MTDYPSLLHDDGDMSGQFPATLHAPRGQKRSLTAAFPGGSGPGTLRTAVACRACRERKTRCSGHQPTCNYCSRAGLPCEYLPGVVSAPLPGPQLTPDGSLDEWGGRILSAVEDLKQIVTARSVVSHQRRVGEDASFDLTAVLSAGGHADKSETSQDDARHQHMPLPGPSPITSLLSILQWTPFNEVQETSMAHVARAAEIPTRSPSAGLESASCNTSDLLPLVAAFAAHQDRSLPVIDVSTLRNLIIDIGEFGVPWTAGSCLVLLVAALGSLLPSLDTAYECHDPEVLTPQALRFWNMARKRLAWAATEGGLIGAQCHFLAGIWQLYDSDPRASWKSLTVALQTIDDDEDAITPAEHEVRENIRTLTLTLLSRLRGEMSLSFVPTSYHLASRPRSEALDHSQEQLRLAILSLLHIRQKSLATFGRLSQSMSLNETCAVLESLKNIEQQIESWHCELPTQLRFAREWHHELTDPSHAMLHFMYMETYELCLRPCLYLTLHVIYSPSATNNNAESMEVVVREHIKKEVWKLYRIHRRRLSWRLQNCLQTRTPFVEPGWLKRQTYAMLGLLHIASDKADLPDGITERDHRFEVDSHQSFLARMGSFLENDRLCPQASTSYSTMLRELRAQLGEVQG